ncbi:hypothetical protein [Xenorhabdus innexi]|uniref:hypothetical protein n=1 Tax=Xenorhabdus innexi TaxID=290109 RepID=UPI00117C6465|nr:hypothetical protein [Xenorhabdus innexi]
MKLKEDDLQFEDFHNFYPAKEAYEDAYREKLRKKASYYAFPYIEHILTLIRRATKNGKFEIEYSPLCWDGPDSCGYTTYFLQCAGYKIERTGLCRSTLKIEWDEKIYANLD